MVRRLSHRGRRIVEKESRVGIIEVIPRAKRKWSGKHIEW